MPKNPNTNPARAKIADVDFGAFTLPGLAREKASGGYETAVAAPQISDVFSLLRHNASRDIKRLLGKDSSPLRKWDTELNSQPVIVILPDDFEEFLTEFAFLEIDGRNKNMKPGRDIARNFLRLSTRFTIEERILSTLGLDPSKEQRDELFAEFSKERGLARDYYKEIAMEIEDYGIANGLTIDTTRTLRIDLCNQINIALFGKKSSEIRKDLGLDEDELIRDHFSSEALRRIRTIEEFCLRNMTVHLMPPALAVDYALRSFAYDVISYQ